MLGIWEMALALTGMLKFMGIFPEVMGHKPARSELHGLMVV